MSAGQKFPWILDWRGLPGRAPGAAEVLSLVFCWRPPVCAGGVLAEKGKPSLAEVLSLGLSLFGTSRGSGELELQLSKRAAGVNVPMACAAEVLSLVFDWRPPVCARQVLAEKWNPSLAEALSLGLGMGLGAGLGWEPLGVVKQRKTPRQRDRGAGLTAKP